LGESWFKMTFSHECGPNEAYEMDQKAAPNPTAAAAATRGIVGASGSKGAASGGKKSVAAAPKCRIPAARMLVEVSLAETQKSSPHEPLPQGSAPEVMMRPEHEVSLQITSTPDVDRASILNVVAAITAGDRGDTLESCEDASEDDKILLNYLEHVSYAKVGWLTYWA
jgi:hypothetical protein